MGRAVRCWLLGGHVRHAGWADIDLDAAEWQYTVTKTDTQAHCPLSPQAVAVLSELQPMTGRGRYVFRARATRRVTAR